MKLQHLLMGSAAFAVSVYSGYMYATPMKSLQQQTTDEDSPGSCAFDRLAGVYDRIIGSEERYMFYGWLRWWLLRNAKVSGRAATCNCHASTAHSILLLLPPLVLVCAIALFVIEYQQLIC